MCFSVIYKVCISYIKFSFLINLSLISFSHWQVEMAWYNSVGTFCLRSRWRFFNVEQKKLFEIITFSINRITHKLENSPGNVYKDVLFKPNENSVTGKKPLKELMLTDTWFSGKAYNSAYFVLGSNLIHLWNNFKLVKKIPNTFFLSVLKGWNNIVPSVVF